MTEKSFAEREVIFQEGDISDVAYVIRSGSVDILKHGDSGEIKLAELAAGEVFGEMGLFDPKSPRSATARARENTLVDIISSEDLHQMIGQCPPRLMPIINSVFERLRQTNQRVKQKEQATALLEIDAERVVVSPASEHIGALMQPVEMPVAHLPLKIGGYLAGSDSGTRAKGNQVNIPSDNAPLAVSVNHCEVIVLDGGLYVRDLGSRFGTVVNGQPIGRGKGKYRAALQKGENLVILGDKKTSLYRLTVTCA